MRRRFAVTLVVVGSLLVAYAAAVVLWRDPATDLYARWQQQRLDDALAKEFVEFQALAVDAPTALPDPVALEATRETPSAEDLEAAVAADARRLQKRLRLGQPLGRITIPKLDVEAVFVHGTRWAQDLSRGPGHYKETELPGLGKTAAIAAHRTTFGAWFRRIDDLEQWNLVELRLPYGTIIRDRGFDTLVLSACHPLYSAEQRWVVYARLVQVKPRDGPSYQLTRSNAAVLEGRA